MRSAARCAGRAVDAIRGGELDIAAEHLREAQREMGAVTGAVGAEEVLGEVFGSFCIGK